MTTLIQTQENKNEEDRRINLRQLLFALAISANHSLICLFYYSNNNIRLALIPLLSFLAFIWLGNLLVLKLFLSGKTANLKDPVLTVPLMLWIGTGIVVSAYFLDSFRLSMLMLLLGIMLLGVFRVGFKSFLLVMLSAIFGYACVLFLVISNFSKKVDATVEVIELLMFSMVTLGMLVTVTRISALQKSLSKQADDLSSALITVHELAVRDELTGLYNRRKIMELLREQIKLSETGGYSFVICYLDLDHFKSINDTYGHGVGDEVIKRFADVSMKAIRSIDYAGRLGGEEFIVVLTNTKLNECLVVAERIRKNIECEQFEQMPSRSVTVSVGVAEYRESEGLESLLNRADNNLYISKDTGRNKITFE